MCLASIALLFPSNSPRSSREYLFCSTFWDRLFIPLLLCLTLFSCALFFSDVVTSYRLLSQRFGNRFRETRSSISLTFCPDCQSRLSFTSAGSCEYCATHAAFLRLLLGKRGPRVEKKKSSRRRRRYRCMGAEEEEDRRPKNPHSTTDPDTRALEATGRRADPLLQSFPRKAKSKTVKESSGEHRNPLTL